ncbi:MAG TPA: AAA family ATPase [Candidatus Methylomirabilis sp.]|nr:AAA family ATPase [Candidatus Methylomirabilis sp.]
MTETTTVTVLFTDVVGSTGLRQHHGDKAAHAIMSAHEEIVRAQLDKHAGQEIKTIGDSFMIAFDSARKAVECAVDIQRGLHAYNRAHPAQLVKVRIGLHTGEAIRSGRDLLGTSVDAAARIMARAEGEQILISDILKAVLGAAKDLSFKDHKRVSLKGLPERWRLWEVMWRSDADAQPTASAGDRSAVDGRTPYVGRSGERATLRRLVERAVAGSGSIALIAGEAGLGKTRLVDETALEARARGMFVVRGQCHDMEGAPPYLPFVEAIEYGLTVAARDVFRAAMGEAGPEIARFVPKVRVAFPDLPPPLALPTDQARHYMFESVCDFFARAAAIQPLLIMLEDLHWADESTTQMLETVARRADRSALLVIGNYRDVDLVPGHPMMRAIEHLSRLPALTRIALKRLSVAEVAEILKSLAGQDPPERLVQLIFAETEGVPFFVEEVYRHLAEERRLTDAAGEWLPQVAIGEIEVPETVRLVLARRIDRIGEIAQGILTTAACIGRTFTFDLLTAVSETKEDDLFDPLEEAERARLIVAEEGRQPRFVFAHEQIRQTLLARMSSLRRQRLHRRVADTLERLHEGHLEEHVSDLAYHLVQAGAGERAAKYLHQAGASAAGRLATPEALASFARAAELAGPGPTRRAALRARGELLLGLFRGSEAAADLEAAVREAAEQRATAEEMEALLRLGRAYYVVGLDHRPAIAQSLQALERARTLAEQLGDRHAEARALIPTHRHVDFDPAFLPQAAANAKHALAIARELRDEDLEVDAMRAALRTDVLTIARELPDENLEVNARRTALRTDILPDRITSLERIEASLERRGDLIALNEHLFDSMWAYWRAARFADCVACSDRATALAARLGIPPVQYATIKSLALVDLGRFDEAWHALEQEIADEAHRFGQAFQHLGRTWWHAAAAEVDRVLRDVPRVFADAGALQRAWMRPWAEDLLASAIVASRPEGTRVASLRTEVEAAGGRLAGDALIAAQLRGGDADEALAECSARQAQLERRGRIRAYWIVEEMKVRALLALGRFADARQASDVALAVVTPLGWRSVEWRLRASRAAALAELGDQQSEAERTAARDLLMAIAKTLGQASVRERFLSQPAAAALFAQRRMR